MDSADLHGRVVNDKKGTDVEPRLHELVRVRRRQRCGRTSGVNPLNFVGLKKSLVKIKNFQICLRN